MQKLNILYGSGLNALKWEEIEKMINEGGGGPVSIVTITPTLQTGVKIADFTIDGEEGSLYAPESGEDTYTVFTRNDDFSDLVDAYESNQAVAFEAYEGKTVVIISGAYDEIDGWTFEGCDFPSSNSCGIYYITRDEEDHPGKIAYNVYTLGGLKTHQLEDGGSYDGAFNAYTESIPLVFVDEPGEEVHVTLVNEDVNLNMVFIGYKIAESSGDLIVTEVKGEKDMTAPDDDILKVTRTSYTVTLNV